MNCVADWPIPPKETQRLRTIRNESGRDTAVHAPEPTVRTAFVKPAACASREDKLHRKHSPRGVQRSLTSNSPEQHRKAPALDLPSWVDGPLINALRETESAFTAVAT